MGVEIMEEKTIIGLVGITAVTALQVIAWSAGLDGAVFALTSLVIGGVVGATYGFKAGVKK